MAKKKTVIDNLTISLRSHEPSLLDGAVDTLARTLLDEKVEFHITLPPATGVGSDRQVGADVTIIDTLDKIGRAHLLSRLQTVDLTKNVHISISLN